MYYSLSLLPCKLHSHMIWMSTFHSYLAWGHKDGLLQPGGPWIQSVNDPNGCLAVSGGIDVHCKQISKYTTLLHWLATPLDELPDDICIVEKWWFKFKLQSQNILRT